MAVGGLLALACIAAPERRAQWDLMKSNFGTRWEGQTRWFKPSARGGLEPSAPPMRSVYQLEFPSATPELGAWRGWSVIEPGDTRVVPLAEATVMERTAGSTTFQFAGAGGRVSLRTDGDGWGCEVNFFHARRRSGLCAFYGAGGELRGAMSMRFRAAPISRDGNVSFVGGGEHTVDHAADPIVADAAPASAPPVLRAPACARALSLAPPAYAISPSAPARATEDWSDTRDESLVVAGFADGVWLRAPRVLSSDSTVSIGCDFRAVGGPFRAVGLLFSDAEFAGVTCHDFARS